MAKTATPIARIELPKTLPAGLEIVECKRTVSEGTGDDKKTSTEVVSFVVPENTAEGISNYIKFLSESGPQGEDGEGGTHGIAFAAAALRSAVVSTISSKLTPSTVEDSTTILPPVSDIRTVDKAAAAGDKMAAFVRDNGRAPNATELADLFSGLLG